MTRSTFSFERGFRSAICTYSGQTFVAFVAKTQPIVIVTPRIGAWGFVRVRRSAGSESDR